MCGWALRESIRRGGDYPPVPEDMSEMVEIYGAVLEHCEMQKLADLFNHWGHAEELTDDRRTRLFTRASTFARLAAHCGPDWRPNSSERPPGILKFIAQDAIAGDHGRSTVRRI